jgi:hypothetical protein
MKKIFKVKELESLYSGEWVLLVNPKHIERLERLRGELVFHSKDRNEVYKEARKRKDAHTAIFYVGKKGGQAGFSGSVSPIGDEI